MVGGRFNQCFFTGMVFRPEFRTTANGNCIIKFALAVDGKVTKEGDSWKTETAWLDCIAFGKDAESLKDIQEKSLLTGAFKVEQESWDDKTTGQKRTKLVFKLTDGWNVVKLDKASNNTNTPKVSNKNDFEPEDSDESPF